MSEKTEADAKPRKKGKGLVFKLLAGVCLLGAGGGAAYGMMQAGLIPGSGHGAEKKEDNSPKLILKGEKDPYAPVTKEKEGEGVEFVEGEGGSKYRTTYYTFAEDFTSNLKNSEALVQASLAASTQRDGRVLMWMKKHELAIRSELLTVLADTPEQDIYDIKGKERLQKRLTDGINKVLTRNEGFGGVDAVYFRSFIIQ